VSEPGAVATG